MIYFWFGFDPVSWGHSPFRSIYSFLSFTQLKQHLQVHIYKYNIFFISLSISYYSVFKWNLLSTQGCYPVRFSMILTKTYFTTFDSELYASIWFVDIYKYALFESIKYSTENSFFSRIEVRNREAIFFSIFEFNQIKKLLKAHLNIN